ncbi:cell surface protein [Methanosarcina sp. KYL-1]|uniref:cell surface protein n=1 Tax=Methanosarcina sp. KYL-1 TaxID=2602068 RepID=UPI002101039F|nr:cell surface protein [Methanosarcina sp. KYL-1]MCQ1535922.1 cell surface protein [Methanosarcina sp. KYL-1]
MSWIKKLLGKKESSREEIVSREISFEELPGWLDEGFRNLSSKIEKDASGLFRELEASLEDLKESNAALMEAKVVGDFDVRAVKRAKSNRENMMKQVGILADKIRVPEKIDVRALEEFNEIALQSLNSCMEHMGRSFRYTRVVFPQESKEVTDSLARIGKVLQDFRDLFTGYKKELDALEAASGNYQGIKDLSASIGTEKREIELKENKIQGLKSELSETGLALEAFRQGETWKQFQSLQEELDEAESRLKQAESGLTSLVLPLSNTLSRLQKLHETGRYTLKPEVKQQINIYLKEPENVDPIFFPDLQKVLEDNALDMQAQKKEKALLQVKAAISGFEARKKEFLEARCAFKAKKAEISSLDTGKLAELEHRKTELGNRIRLLEEELEQSGKKLEVSKEQLEARREKLLKDVSVIDSSVKLIISS